MDIHGWITLAVLISAAVLFTTRWIPIPMTAMAIPVLLHLTGVLPDLEEALSGFRNQAVIAIGAIMIIGAGLRESGVAGLMARAVTRMGGKGEFRTVILVMTATAILAVFMNNTAVVAMLLPATLALSRRSGIPASRLMMPMAFGAVLGGTVTLIGTAPNFLVAAFYQVKVTDGTEIGVFDFAPVGIPITIAGILLMSFIGRWLLPQNHTERGHEGGSPDAAVEKHELSNRLFEMKVVAASRLVGKSISEVDIGKRYGLNVILIQRPASVGTRWLIPTVAMRLQEGDVIYLQGTDLSAWDFSENEHVQFGLATPGAIGKIVEGRTSVVEIMVAPGSKASGLSIRQLDFRQRHDLTVISIHGGEEEPKESLPDVPLEEGAVMLVSGTARAVWALRNNPDFILLTDLSQQENFTRAPIAIGWLLFAVIPTIFLGWPLPITAMGGAVGMVATRCLARPAVVTSIDWSVLALIVGTVPLGDALQRQGISDAVAQGMGDLALGGGPVVPFALLFFGAAVLSVLSSNSAAAVIMAPVAFSLAEISGLHPRDALLAMAYGCSCNFLLPFAPCNILVTGPGGYRTRDFLRAGSAMTVVMAGTAILALWLRSG